MDKFADLDRNNKRFFKKFRYLKSRLKSQLANTAKEAKRLIKFINRNLNFISFDLKQDALNERAWAKEMLHNLKFQNQ